MGAVHSKGSAPFPLPAVQLFTRVFVTVVFILKPVKQLIEIQHKLHRNLTQFTRSFYNKASPPPLLQSTVEARSKCITGITNIMEFQFRRIENKKLSQFDSVAVEHSG